MTATPPLIAIPLWSRISLGNCPRRNVIDACRMPCDATALLRVKGQWLIPMAFDALSTDAWAAASRSTNIRTNLKRMPRRLLLR